MRSRATICGNVASGEPTPFALPTYPGTRALPRAGNVARDGLSPSRRLPLVVHSARLAAFAGAAALA
jgi:hypothetical protein